MGGHVAKDGKKNKEEKGRKREKGEGEKKDKITFKKLKYIYISNVKEIMLKINK